MKAGNVSEFSEDKKEPLCYQRFEKLKEKHMNSNINAVENRAPHKFEGFDCTGATLEGEICSVEDDITKLRSDLFDRHQYRERLVSFYHDWETGHKIANVSRGLVRCIKADIKKLLREVCLQIEQMEMEITNCYDRLDKLSTIETIRYGQR